MPLKAFEPQSLGFEATEHLRNRMCKKTAENAFKTLTIVCFALFRYVYLLLHGLQQINLNQKTQPIRDIENVYTYNGDVVCSKK